MTKPRPEANAQHRRRYDHEVPYQPPVQFILRALVVFTALLVLAHVTFAVNYHHLGYEFVGSTLLYVLFDFMGEVTIPTWYSTLLLFTCSLLLAGVSAIARRQRSGDTRYWAGLSAIFLLLSMDEAADVHGALSYYLQIRFETDGALSYPWVVLGTVFVAVVGIVYLRFAWRLAPDVRWRVFVAGLVFVGAALGLEVVQALYDSGDSNDVQYITMVAIEEGLEKLALILFISALVRHIAAVSADFRLSLHESARSNDEPPLLAQSERTISSVHRRAG